jgi:sugar phosphate isomerase/epimerase
MKYGVMEGVLRGTREEIFSDAQKLGFDGVELWNINEDAVDELKQLSQKTGVAVASVVCGPQGLASPDAEARKAAKDVLTGVIRRCESVGAGVILVPFFGMRNLENEEAVLCAVEAFKECAKAAAQSKVTLALEMGMNAPDSLELIKRIGSEYVKIYYDVGNATAAGYDVVEEIRLLAGQIAQFHIKDAGGQALGEGKVPMKAACEAIKEIGFDGYLVLETPATDNPPKAAEKNLAYLKQCLGI